MQRSNALNIIELAQILNKAHFEENNPSRSSMRSRSRSASTGNPRSRTAIIQGRSVRVEHGAIMKASRAESRTAFQKALDARERLIQAKKAKAQNIRDESFRYRIERRAKLAEEAALRAMQSRSRMNAWELERRQREAAAMRLQKQRQASEIIRKGEQMVIAHMNQKAELERLKSLQERLMDKQAKKLIPPVTPLKYSAFEGAGETLAETIFRLEMMRKQNDENLAKKRSTIYDRHLENMERKKAPLPPLILTPPAKKKKHSSIEQTITHYQNPLLVKESRAEEMVRLKRELNLLEKYHGKDKK